jgi:two-component system cell cycle sensor histidine kinase PleC
MTRPRGAIASAVRRPPDLRQLDGAAIAGHARLFIHPAYARLVSSERYVKRLIPVTIMLFVAVLAVLRGTALFQAREDAAATARAELALTATAVASELAEAGATMSLAERPEVLQVRLENAIGPQALAGERAVMLVDPEGLVLAAVPRDKNAVGHHSDEILGASQPLTTLGERAGVLPILLANGETVIATLRRDRDGAGAVLLVQPMSAVFADWRRGIAREATVFVATSLVLLMLGFAYHAQTARAEEADFIYAATQDRYHTALRRGRSGLWEWDLARGAVFWSQSMFEILGLEPKDQLMSVGEVAALIHPQEADLVDLANELLAAREGQIDREFRMRHADGGWVWIRIRAEVVADAAEEPHLVGIAVDITEKREMAEASRAADLRLADAVEAVSEAFVLWDSENRLVLCNSKYRQLHQLTDDLVRPGTPYSEIAKHGRPPVIAGEFGEPQEDGEARSVEARVDDGRWLQISERRTKDGGFVSVGTDITTLKLNQARLLENERALTATVADLRRSRQQLEKQAQQLVELAEKYALEKEKAEDASRIKSEFLANVSHELRTPLNAIIGFSELMLSASYGPLGDAKYAEYCRDIRDAGAFLLHVISDILEMARLDAGRIEIDRESLDLAALVADIARQHADEAAKGGATIEVAAEPGVTLSADRQAIRQVLGNLISNAVKFTPEGGAITLRAKRHRGGALLIIEDTGIGIPRTALDKLGRPFEQVQSPLTRSHKGSGLGLAITRSLVALHGGEMDIASKEGIGTTVTVFLPQRGTEMHVSAA